MNATFTGPLDPDEDEEAPAAFTEAADEDDVAVVPPLAPPQPVAPIARRPAPAIRMGRTLMTLLPWGRIGRGTGRPGRRPRRRSRPRVARGSRGWGRSR